MFPTFDVPEIIESQSEQPFKRSWHFDFKTGEFLTDGGNKILEADPYVAWAHWCIKVSQTERFSCLAYSDNIGIESSQIREATSREGAQAVFEKTITEALMIHSNTESVQDFVFAWDNDVMTASFTIYPVEGMPIDSQSTIKL